LTCITHTTLKFKERGRTSHSCISAMLSRSKKNLTNPKPLSTRHISHEVTYRGHVVNGFMISGDGRDAAPTTSHPLAGDPDLSLTSLIRDKRPNRRTPVTRYIGATIALQSDVRNNWLGYRTVSQGMAYKICHRFSYSIQDSRTCPGWSERLARIYSRRPSSRKTRIQ
jgi:hypothetical protein